MLKSTGKRAGPGFNQYPVPIETTQYSVRDHATATATSALLWAACRPDPDVDSCREAIDAGADLELAGRLAVRHRVSGLLWRVVEPWADSDSTWQIPVRDDAMRCRAQAKLVMPRLGPDLLEPLSAAGLRPLVLKGLSLLGRYPAPGLRPMDDVDLFLPREQRREAVEVLCRVGWFEVHRSYSDYSLILAHRGLPGLPLDLHEDVAVRQQRAFRLQGRDLWTVRQPIVLDGVDVFGLSPEWQLLHIATHAAKRFHTFDRLLWAVDASVIIRSANASDSPVDWHRVGVLAREMSGRSAVAVLMAQAFRLGVDSPVSLRELRGSSARRRTLAPVVSHNWPAREIDDPTRNRLAYALVDNPFLELRKAVHDIGEAGMWQAPFRGVVMVVKAIRRAWKLRRGDR